MNINVVTWDDLLVPSDSSRMHELTEQEVHQVSGGACSWRGAARTIVGSAIGGAVGGSLAGPKGAALGGAMGAIGGGAGYAATCWW